jgi:hypothetical protein
MARGIFGQRGVGEREEELTRGACPSLPRKRRWPATLATLYPATKFRSPRAYGVVLSTVLPAGNEIEKTLLPLVDEHNHGPATASLSRRVERH